MKKITSSCPIWNYDISKRYMVTSSFKRYFLEAMPALNDKLFDVQHPEWDRAFYLPHDDKVTNAKKDGHDIVAHLKCKFKNKFIGEFTVYTLVYNHWILRSKYEFVFNRDLTIYFEPLFELDSDSDREHITAVPHLLITTCFFMDVAEIFEEEIKPKEKLRIHNCKYQNKTKQPLIVLNANYLKTSIRTEGFKVRGHFKWQACGPNWSERKLIFIDTYEKSGHTIHAKKDNILSALK